MPATPRLRLKEQMHLTDARIIKDTTSITLLMGPEQCAKWEMARQIAENGTAREWECFTVSQSIRTDNPDYEEYAITLYTKPHPDYPSIKAGSEQLAQAWAQYDQKDAGWQELVKSSFASVENALNKYFSGITETIIQIDTPLDLMDNQQRVDLLDKMNPTSDQ